MQSWFALSSIPALPLAGLAHGSLPLLWGVVLAWLGLDIAARIWPRLPARKRARIAAAVFAISLLPALLSMPAQSPAYWLGLALQSPSLALVTIALYGLWVRVDPRAAHCAKPWQARSAVISVLCMLGVALGWVLLLDMLAFWPRSVYALGFGAGALWAVALGLLMLAWRWQGLAVWALCAVLLAYAISRLPMGNLWDALLDPLLWLGLHAKLLRDLWTQQQAKT